MPYVVQILGRVDGEPTSLDGMWLRAYDPHHEDGVGLIDASPQRRHAMEFDDLADFHRLYTQSHGVRPWDGKPNRPLTAFNLRVERR